MISLLLLILLVTFLAYNYYNKYQKQWKYLATIPGPRPLPIFGNVTQLGLSPSEYLKSLMKWWREYNNDIFKIWIGNEPLVFITNPKDIECVLTSNILLQKSDMYDFLHPWLGQGLLTSSGSKWFKHRKMITPSFHFKILVDFLDVMIKNSNNLIKVLNVEADSGEIFDIQELFHLCTLDVICETAMGTEINALTNNDNKIAAAIQDMCQVIQIRAFSSLSRYDFLFKFTKLYKMQENALRVLKSYTMEIIENRRKYLINLKNPYVDNDEFNRKKKAFLDNLLTATVDDRPLTNQEIYEEVSTFMFEGHDTTSSGVSYCSFLLSRHPNIQRKVYEEQKSLFGDNIKTINPSFQNMQEMKYLEIVIKECQRLYCSVPLIGRYTADKPFDLCGRTIPPNTTIIPFIFAMGYNENCFDDHLKFNPDRFNPENLVGKNPYEYVPFSAGPRNCIGQKYAMLEMKSIISNIIRHFEILPPNENCIREDNYEVHDPSDKYDPILATVLTLKSDNGIQIRLKHRH